MNKFYTQYSPNQKNRLMNCKKNVIHLGANELIKHELSKCVGAIMIHKWGDVQFNANIIQQIDTLAYLIEATFDIWDKQTTDFLTEAWLPNRRIDLVNLQNDSRIEFETDHKEDKRKKFDDDNTVNIYI